MPLTFLIKTGPDATATDCNFIVSGTELLAMDSYAKLQEKLATQNQANLIVTLEDNQFTFWTQAIGPIDGVLTYMQDSTSTASEGGYIVGGDNIGTFADYKDGHADCKFTVKDGDDADIMDVNLPTAALNSWDELAQAITTASAGALIVKYNATGDGHLFICRTVLGLASTLAAGGASGEDAAVLKLTTGTGAVVTQGVAGVAAVQHANELLKGTQAAGATKWNGQDTVGKKPIFMQSFKQVLDSNGIDPALLVLSPHADRKRRNRFRRYKRHDARL